MDKIYLNNYILSYHNILNLFAFILEEEKYKGKIKKNAPIGYSTFDYPIDEYTIGNGTDHVLLIGCTHGCEIITTYFVIEFILALLNDDELYNKVKDKYTFHFIPILNPEGYVISTSNLIYNLKDKSNKDLEKISTTYLEEYNKDDIIASQNICAPKNFMKVLSTSLEDIQNFNIKKSVKNILKSCNLSSSILPVWSANACGIDLNSNSIHKYKDMVKLRKKQKCAALRYNDIPVTKPSPMSYPGQATFEKRCPENFALYNYIQELYKMNGTNESDNRLISIFSYHSTGGEIYGYPDIDYATEDQINLHIDAMDKYSEHTNYKKIDEYLKYGVMDFYRIALEGVVTLTIELSKLNGNPIGPLSSLNDFNNEIIDNKKAVIHTINYLANL